MTRDDPDRPDWLALAELLANADDDDQALLLFRAITGLSGTDPVADRLELERRIEQNKMGAHANSGAAAGQTESDPAGGCGGCPHRRREHDRSGCTACDCNRPHGHRW